MTVLLVHGMGRSPLSWAPLRLRLQAAGYRTVTFGYCAALEGVAGIQRRLATRMAKLAGEGRYVVVGHSLGGVLLRGALGQGPSPVPRPTHLFLLGSPVRPAAMAVRLKQRWMYQCLTGEAGQLLASGPDMAALGAPPIPTTAIVGTRGWVGATSPFAGASNDGLVALTEARAPWIGEECQVPVPHSFLPSSGKVAEALIACLGRLSRA